VLELVSDQSRAESGPQRATRPVRQRSPPSLRAAFALFHTQRGERAGGEGIKPVNVGNMFHSSRIPGMHSPTGRLPFDGWLEAVQVGSMRKQTKPATSPATEAEPRRESEEIANATVGAVVGGLLAGPVGLMIGAAAGSLVEEDRPKPRRTQRGDSGRRSVKRPSKRRSGRRPSGE
jgi:hypothetical protein